MTTRFCVRSCLSIPLGRRYDKSYVRLGGERGNADHGWLTTSIFCNQLRQLPVGTSIVCRGLANASLMRERCRRPAATTFLTTDNLALLISQDNPLSLCGDEPSS